MIDGFVNLGIPDFVGFAAAIHDLRGEFPLLKAIDEFWIAETHDDRVIVLFEPLVHGRPYAPVYTFNGDRLLHATDG